MPCKGAPDNMVSKKNDPLTVETLKHDDATRKNIPTAEYQSVMASDEQKPVRVAYARRARQVVGCPSACRGLGGGGGPRRGTTTILRHTGGVESFSGRDRRHRALAARRPHQGPRTAHHGASREGRIISAVRPRRKRWRPSDAVSCSRAAPLSSHLDKCVEEAEKAATHKATSSSPPRSRRDWDRVTARKFRATSSRTLSHWGP